MQRPLGEALTWRAAAVLGFGVALTGPATIDCRPAGEAGRAVKPELFQGGQPGQAGLGVRAFRIVTSELRRKLRLPDFQGGLIVDHVYDGGPAAVAGLRRDDVIVKLDGAVVGGDRALNDEMARRSVGQEVRLEVQRGPENLGLVVRLFNAVAFLEEACTARDAKACGDLGVRHVLGRGVEKDVTRRLARYRQACGGGDALGCSGLGAMYYGGEGVARDDARAAALFQQSCDAGHPGGCSNLGAMYETGRGLAEDDRRAVTLLQQACDAGEATACSNLGFLYANGRGVARDEARAMALYRDACDAGEADACEKAAAGGPAGPPQWELRSELLGIHPDAVCGAAFSPDGRRLATGDFDGRVKVWTLASRRAVQLSAHRDKVCGLSFDPKGRWLATGGWDDRIRVWEAAGVKSLRVLQAPAGVQDVAFSPDGAVLASVDLKGHLRLWNPATGAPLAGRAVSPQNLNAVAFTPDGKTIAVAGQGETIHLLDARTLEERAAWPTPGRQVFGLVFTPDGGRLLSSEGGASGRPEANWITIWTAATGTTERTLKGHREFVYSVDVSPDGTLIASSSLDASVRLWSLDGRALAVLEDHHERVHRVRFAPDGKTLVSVSGPGKLGGVAGEDNSVRLWRLER